MDFRLSRMRPSLRKRNTRKINCLLDTESPVSAKSNLPHDRINVDDNIMTIPSRTKKLKRTSEEAGSSFDFGWQSSKKVRFSDVVDSHFIKEKFTFLTRAQCNQSLPRSILKQTGSTIRRNERKNKKRVRTSVVHEMASEARESKTSKQMKAFVYLDTWKNCKDDWKFEKVLQTWLLKNMFNSLILPDEKFDLLLEYMIEMRGAAVSLARRLSTKIIQHSDRTSEKDVTPEASYHRAKLVLQYLPE